MMGNPFFIKSATLAAIATGEHALSLIEFRDKLLSVPLDCIYHHVWGIKLFPRFTHPEYQNEFAMWAHQALNDDSLAEKLSILDPSEYAELEDLRADIIEITEQRMDEYEILAVARKEEMFHFVRSSIIIFDTPHILHDPSELPGVLPSLSQGSFFYHFIDAKSRTETKWNDFSTWLIEYGDAYRPLIERINAIDPYFFPLSSLRENVISVVNKFFEIKNLHLEEEKCQ